MIFYGVGIKANMKKICGFIFNRLLVSVLRMYFGLDMVQSNKTMSVCPKFEILSTEVSCVLHMANIRSCCNSLKEYFASPSMNQTVQMVREKLDKVRTSMACIFFSLKLLQACIRRIIHSLLCIRFNQAVSIC